MNKNIKQDADNLLDKYRLIEKLSTYGKPHVVGSYFLDLMARREIDINIEVENPSQVKISDLLKEVVEVLKPRSINYRNRTMPEKKIRIDGHWIMVKTIDGWSLDIWIIGKEESSKQQKQLG